MTEKTDTDKLDLNELLAGTFLEELATIQDKDPGAPVADGERVFGEMSKVERKLYALGQKYAKLAMLIAAEAEFESENMEDRDRLMGIANNTRDSSSAVREVMWAIIRDRLHLITHGMTVGVRKNFQVVCFKPKKKGLPESIKRALEDKIGGTVRELKLASEDGRCDGDCENCEE
jgi:hypothetical protein